MESLFFNTEIISKDSSTLERMANRCLMPVRYLFHGRSIEIFEGKIRSENLSFPERKWHKTVLAVLGLIPGVILGLVLKLSSLPFSSSNENQHLIQENAQKPVDDDDVALIYSPDPKKYRHFLPRPIFESYFSGQAFDYQKNYTKKEKKNAQKDLVKIFDNIMAENPIKLPLAIMTAGAPGSGKTTLLKQDRAKEVAQGRTIAYICPDDVCLKGMEMTYLAEVKANLKSAGTDAEKRQILADAYTKYRPQSNAVAQMILAHFIRNNYAFYFGTTSTSPTAVSLFKLLKEKGYTIKLLHITAPEDVRWESIAERDKTFVQTTETDIREKGKLVPQKINDYLAYADHIQFYYRGGIHDDATLAAEWVRNEKHPGNLTIVDQPSYDQIKAIHNGICNDLGKPDLNWEATVEQSSTLSAATHAA